VGALHAFAAVDGLKLQHVKPHGALYNMAVKNSAVWEAVAEVLARVDRDLILVVLAGSNRKELKSMGSVSVSASPASFCRQSLQSGRSSSPGGSRER